jgi:phytoene desaturase
MAGSAHSGSGKRVVVVGAGFSGLASASLLAREGFEVLVLEKNASAGGRAQVYRKDGFTFDMGPSWYLMPDIFERFFSHFDRKPEDYYQTVRLDPSYRIFFGRDDYVDISADFEANVALFESCETGAGEKLREYVRIAAYKYDAAINEFLYKDYRSIFDFFTRRTMTEGRKLHVFENIDRYASRFFKDERLRRILQYSMVFLGGSPANTPALYSLLSHVDFNLGVWYPVGGIGSVVEGMRKLAESLGVQFLFDHEVTRLGVRGRRLESILTNQSSFPADAVLMSADYAHSEIDLLLPPHQTYREDYWKKRVMAPSAVMLYLGFDGPVPNVLHHTLSFQHDWMKHFDAIFKAPAWPEEFSYYVCCPTKTDPSVAPPGCETMVLLVPVASALDDDDETRERFSDKAVGLLEDIAGEPLRDRIVSRTIFSQRDFRGAFNAYKGTALGLSHTLMQSAVFRPSHRSKKVDNLYYTGQYTHPGIGLSMALISAEVASKILADEQSRK